MSDSEDSPLYLENGKYKLVEIKKGKNKGKQYWKLVRGATVNDQKDCPPNYIFEKKRTRTNRKGETVVVPNRCVPPKSPKSPKSPKARKPKKVLTEEQLARKLFRELNKTECKKQGGTYIAERKSKSGKTLKAYCSKQKPAGDKKEKKQRKKMDINLRNLKKGACHKLGGTYVKARQITDSKGKTRNLKAYCKGAVSPAMMTKEERKKMKQKQANKLFRELNKTECKKQGGTYIAERESKSGKTLKAYCSKQKPSGDKKTRKSKKKPVSAIVLDIDNSSVLEALIGKKIRRVSKEKNTNQVDEYKKDPKRMAPPFHASAFPGKRKKGQRSHKNKFYVSSQRADGVWTWTLVAKSNK